VNTFIGIVVIIAMVAFVLKLGYDKIMSIVKPKKAVETESIVKMPQIDEKAEYRKKIEALNEEDLYKLSYEEINRYGKYYGNEGILRRWSLSNKKCYHCGEYLVHSVEDIPHYDANHDYVEYVRENVECLKCKNCGRLIY